MRDLNPNIETPESSTDVGAQQYQDEYSSFFLHSDHNLTNQNNAGNNLGVPPFENYSSLLHSPSFSQPVNTMQNARLMRKLQQRYGNHYVQRILSEPHRSQRGDFPMQRRSLSSPGYHGDLDSLPRGGGFPLDDSSQASMGSRFGEDFGDVRLHTDQGSARAAEDLGASAFTTGRDIYFGQNAYDPESPQGKSLLAHELTHVVQQSRGAVRPGISQPGDVSEREAESVGNAILQGQDFSIAPHSANSAVQMQEENRPAPTPAETETPPATRTPSPPTRPGEYALTIVGVSIPIPFNRIPRRFKKEGKIEVPDITRLPGLRRFRIPGLKSLKLGINLDENDQPVGGDFSVDLAIPPLDGQGSGSIDQAGNASGSASVTFRSNKIPGLRETTLTAGIKNDDFSIEGDIGFDLPKVTGSLHYKYANKKHSGKGKAEYQGKKLRGAIEVIMSEAGKISGSGSLDMELFKGLRGKADVAVDEKRNIQVKGKLAVPGEVELFPEKKYEKNFFTFEKKFPLWGITIPVIDVNVGIFAEIHAGAGFRSKFGPGVLRNIELTGEFGTDPEAATEFGLGGEFFVPAAAEVVANVGGGIGLGLLIADITGGIEAVGVAGLYTALTVRPNFKYAGGKYIISGMAELAGVAQLKFGINAFAKIDVGVWLFKGTVWRKDWTLAEWIWNTGLNVALRANISYTLGEDFAPEISFETGKVDPEAFIKDVMPESGTPVPAPPKPPVPDKASFTAEGKTGKQKAGAAPKAPATKRPGAPRAGKQSGAAPTRGVPTGAAAAKVLPPPPAALHKSGPQRTEQEDWQVYEYEMLQSTRPTVPSKVAGAAPQRDRTPQGARGAPVTSPGSSLDLDSAYTRLQRQNPRNLLTRDKFKEKFKTHYWGSTWQAKPDGSADHPYPIWWPTELTPVEPIQTHFVRKVGAPRDESETYQARREWIELARERGLEPGWERSVNFHHVWPLFLSGPDDKDNNVVAWPKGAHQRGHSKLRYQRGAPPPPAGMPLEIRDLYKKHPDGTHYEWKGEW